MVEVRPLEKQVHDLGAVSRTGVLPVCALDCPDGVFVGWWKDVPRVGYLTGNITVWLVMDSAGEPVDYGNGWWSASIDPDFEQAAPGPAGTYSFRMHHKYPADDGYAALYVVKGPDWVPDDPPGAYCVEALAWHDGCVWAAGLKVAAPRTVEAPVWDDPPAGTPAGLRPPARECGWREYNRDTGKWDRLGMTTQQVLTLSPALWWKDQDGWHEVTDFIPYQDRRVDPPSASLWKPSVAFFSTRHGLYLQEKRYQSQLRPVLKVGADEETGDGGQVWFRAYKTWLRDGTGNFSDVGYSAVIADDGETVQVIGPESLWRGPSVQFVGKIGEVQIPRVNGIQRDVVPVGAPVYWRGDFWLSMLDRSGTGQHLARLERTGLVSVVWTRDDVSGGVLPGGYETVRTQLCADRELYLWKGIGLLHRPIIPSDPTREYVMRVQGPLVQSVPWGSRVFLGWAGIDGGFALGVELGEYHYSSNAFGETVSGFSWLISGDYGPTYPTRTWHVWNWPSRVQVHRTGIEWGSEPLPEERPSVDLVGMTWGSGPRTRQLPEVTTVGLQWANGQAGETPGVDKVGVQYRDRTAASAFPEVETVGVDWAAGDDYYQVDGPEADKIGVEWGNGLGGLVPDVDKIGMTWRMDHPSAPGVVSVGKVGVQWADRSGADRPKPEVYRAGVEWSMAVDGPDGEQALHIVDARRDRTCFALRVCSTLTPAQEAQVRVLVRADREDLAPNLWSSYQKGTLGEDLYLEAPGRQVRVAIIGPVTLPKDTDFAVYFERG